MLNLKCKKLHSVGFEPTRSIRASDLKPDSLDHSDKNASKSGYKYNIYNCENYRKNKIYYF